MTASWNAGDKPLTFDLRAGAIIDGQGGNFIGLDGPRAGTRPTIILGGVFQHFGNATSPGWMTPIVTRPNWVIDGSEFRYNYQIGLIAQGDNTRIANAYIHDNGRYGLNVTDACSGCPSPTGILVEGTEIAFNNTRHEPTDNDAGGTKFVGSTNMTVRNSYVHDNYGSGLWFDISNRGAQVYGNTITNNLNWGIFWEISYSAEIHDNVLTGNAAASNGSWYDGVQLLVSCSDGTGSGISIYNNTVDGTAKAIGVISFDHGKPDRNLSKNVYVHDNTVFLRAAGDKVGAVDQSGTGVYASMFAPGNIRFESNTYRVLDTAAVHFQWQGQKTWTQWLATGHDLNGSITLI
jgi:hypothetical protein